MESGYPTSIIIHVFNKKRNQVWNVGIPNKESRMGFQEKKMKLRTCSK